MRNALGAASGAAPVHSWRLLMLSALALLFALCGGSGVPRADGAAVRLTTSPASAPAASGPSYAPTLVPQTRLALADAWGNVTIHRLPTRIDQQHVFIFENAVSPDGSHLLGVVAPRDVLSNTSERSVLALYDVATRQVTRLRQLQNPQSQVIGASMDASWIVWSEADDQPNFFDWRLFAYSRETGAVRQLAQAVMVNGAPVPGPTPMPAVDQGRVVWGQAIGPLSSQNLDNAVVRVADLATGQVTTLATRAGSPAYRWPWVIWGQVAGGGSGYESLKNLQTGQTLQLPAQAASLALAGNSLAYNDSSVTRAYVIDDVTRGAPKLLLDFSTSAAPDHVQFLSLSDRLVAWTEDSDTEVWDRAQQVFVRLPVSSGTSGSWVGGHMLVWTDPEPADQQQQDVKNNLIPTGTLDVIDTSALPAQPVHG